jgi:hypothetical protein
MVGGSTLLRRSTRRIEARFGREAVRAWHPFEAVVQGAARFASGSAADLRLHRPRLRVRHVRPRDAPEAVRGGRAERDALSDGKPDYWKRQLVPTCSLGEPETMFKLVICELGRARDGDRRFSWDQHGKLHVLSADGEEDQQLVVVPLNDSNPTLGYLRPPHPPDDKKPRLEIEFGVNAERWLCASVFDIKTRRYMMRQEPVVRLL